MALEFFMEILNKNKKLLLSIFCLVITSTLDAQHVLKKGPIQVMIQVMMGNEELSIESLCDGFDPETNAPINLIIPEHSAVMISRNELLADANVLVKTRRPRFIFKPIDRSGHESESSPGSSKTYTYIHEPTADTLSLSWKIAYRNIELTDLYPASYFPDYMAAQLKNRPTDFSEQTNFDWKQQVFIQETDERGLPVKPKFPYSKNGLFFIFDAFTEDAVVQLKGFHETPQRYVESEGFDLFLYENLLPGDYEFMVKPYAEAPDSECLNYPFTILEP